MGVAWDGAYCVYMHHGHDARRPQPWSIPQRRLAHYLVVANLAGEEWITVEGRDHLVHAGDAYLICPGQLHSLRSQANQPAWIHFDVQFDSRRAHHPHAGPYDSQLGARKSLLQPGPRAVWDCDLPVIIPSELAPLVHGLVPRIIATWQRGTPLDLLEANHQLAGLLLSLVGRIRTGAGSGVDATLEQRLARAEAVADRSLAAGFTVADFAAASGYSRSRFSTLYQALRGRSPGQYLRASRMRLACTLLHREELAISEVGALVGYPDPTVFGRVFRATHHLPPGTWRAQARAHDPVSR